MRFPVILWDFDGTLADTLPGALRICNELAARHGFRPLDDLQAARGVPLATLLRSHGISRLRLPFLIRQFLAAQRKEIAGVRLVPGVSEVLRALHQTGRHQSVLSSNDQQNIRTCLGANAVEDLFEAVIGYRRLFGKAKAIRRCLKARQLAASEVLYVGDEVRDIEATRKVGVAVCAVTWGFNTRELLAGHGPDFLIERPEQMVEVLR